MQSTALQASLGGAYFLSLSEIGSQGFLSTGSVEMLSRFEVSESNVFGELAGNEFSVKLLLPLVHLRLDHLTDMCQNISPCKHIHIHYA